MSASTRDILKSLGRSFGRLGIVDDPDGSRAARTAAAKSLTPTVHTSGSVATENFMNQPQVERLVDETVSQSGWLSVVDLKLRQQRSGTIPRMVINDVVTEGVPENAGETVTTHVDTSEVPYEAAKYQATWFLTLETVSEARAAGEPDFDGKVRRAFAKAMGNDMARAAVRGDESLDSSSRLNRLLRQRDGWLVQARTRANYKTTTRGTNWSRKLYPAMKRQLPSQYKDDPDLRWFLAPELDEDYTYALQELGDGAQLRDDALIQRRRWAPMGIPGLLVPQWPTDQGFSTLNGSTADADSVTDNGGTITFRVDTLFGGYDSAHAGRIITVTYDANGQSETLTVKDTGSQLQVTTSGTLGQSSVSTTAGDYSIDLADCTGAMLTNPRNLFVVLCRNIRAYRKWEQEAERWRIDVFYEADFGIHNGDAMVLQEGIVPTLIEFGS